MRIPRTATQALAAANESERLLQEEAAFREAVSSVLLAEPMATFWDLSPDYLANFGPPDISPEVVESSVNSLTIQDLGSIVNETKMGVDMARKKMKPTSKDVLKPNEVRSEAFHVGIELELITPFSGDSEPEHDDEACAASFKDNFDDLTTIQLLTEYKGLSRSEASNIEAYFDRDSFINDMVSEYSCEDEDCSHWSNGANSTREHLSDELKELTGNQSFKVVSDGSVDAESGETLDTEVCWNYYASKETIRDNEKILKYLKDNGSEFNTSCGLHINLNNYLGIDKVTVDTSSLSFLFDFVAKSRRKSDYCNREAVGVNQKYSMIYHQGDRLEFRFFSPTLEAEKLNHYVSLANIVYRRLAGQDAKLSKKTTEYMLNKMTTVNGLSKERALNAINQVNSILPIQSYAVRVEGVNDTENEMENVA